jgi:SAM-dependent methyltransferase
MLGLPGRFAVAECADCGLAVTTPRLERDELAGYYGGGYSPYLAPRGVLAQLLAAYRRWLADRSVRRPPLHGLARRKAGALLDIGCGRGDQAAGFARLGWRVAGLDPSDEAVEAARAQGVEAIVGELDDAPWDPGSFDGVLFNHSLEHMPDPVEALHRAAQLVRPGGLVLISVPDWASWQRRRFGTYWFHLDLPRHLQHFNAGALREAVRRAGLRPLSVESSTSAAGLLASVQYRLFGRCVATGPWLRPALGLVAALYPLTGLVGRALGGDTVTLLADRSDESTS